MQTIRRFRLPIGGQLCGTALFALMWISSCAALFAQPGDVRATSAETAAVIPQQMRFAGIAANRAGDAVEAVFRIYASGEGGEPLWTETQMIAVDANGKYSVLLGSATRGGLPQSLFAGGQARWLGVSIERGEEQPRSLLASVAYAMKAGDAETVGGFPARELVTQEQLAAMAKALAVQLQPTVLPDTTPSGSGTANYLPIWTGASTLGNSMLYQTGGFVGLGTTSPTSPLQISAAYPAVTANATNNTSEFQIRQTTLPIAAGITDSGYRAGALVNNFTTDNNFKGTLKGQYGLWARVGDYTGAGAGTITNSYGVYIDNLTGGSATITNNYGLFQASSTAKNYFAGKVGIGTSTPGAALEVNGTSKFDGLITFAPSQTFPGTGNGTITGVTTTSPLSGGASTGSVSLGLNTSALETTLNGVYAQLGAANTFTGTYGWFDGYVEAHTSDGPGNAGLLGWGSSGSIGTFGDSDTGFGIEGESSSGKGVTGFVSSPAPGASGVLGYTGSSFSSNYSSESSVAYAGIWADTSSSGSAGNPVALFATADNAYGVAAVTNSNAYPGLYINNNGGAGGVISADVGDGLSVSTSGSGNGVLGTVGSASQGLAGVYGTANDNSVISADYNIFAGVWGDTGTSLATVSPAWPIGVLGTADDSYAGVFLNNSNSESTLYVKNYGTAGLGSAAKPNPLFSTIMAVSPEGTCGIGGGSLSCTGQIKSLVPANGGTRNVETYAMQSPENWMEDFGSGQLQRGVAVISIDPAFAETISGDSSYHVFLTPNADCKGLYVIRKTATTFEVRESGGGTSSLLFDYRIVGKRRGYEAQRLNDVTESVAAATRLAEMPRAAVKSRTLVRKPSPLALALKSPHRAIVPPPAPVDRRR